MTDREAIRRLAATVARYAERNREGQLRSEVMELLDSLAEPAAPTVTKCCVCGRRVVTKEDGGPEVQLADNGKWVCCEGCWDKAVGSLDAPTVTREQAERVVSLLYDYEQSLRETGIIVDWPAFFRSAADALEGE